LLFAVSFTQEAAFLFYGASMPLSTAGGYAGRELRAVPNRLLRREDEIGCAVVAPVDALDRPATGSPRKRDGHHHESVRELLQRAARGV